MEPGQHPCLGAMIDEVAGVGNSENKSDHFPPYPPLGRKKGHLNLKASASERLGSFCLKDSLVVCPSFSLSQ